MLTIFCWVYNYCEVTLPTTGYEKLPVVFHFNIYVVLQFYPSFNFHFCFFIFVHYHIHVVPYTNMPQMEVSHLNEG